MNALLLACACNGRDEHCESCGGRGHTRFTGDPVAAVSDSLWGVMQLSRFARDGSWPMDGGTLDQSQSFLDACNLIWRTLDDIQSRKHG